MKRVLAVSLGRSKAVWGSLFDGRTPKPWEEISFFNQLNTSTKDRQYQRGRASKDLRQIFSLGHPSGITLLALHRFLKASVRWGQLQDGPRKRWNPETTAQIDRSGVFRGRRLGCKGPEGIP